VIGASIKSCFRGSAPVLLEAIVSEVAAFGGLDVGERDTIARDLSPIDHVLVSGYVDSVPLVFLQGRPPVRDP
jgi:hypothetical protein